MSEGWRSAELSVSDWSVDVGPERADELTRVVRGVAGSSIEHLAEHRIALPGWEDLLARSRAELEHGKGFLLLRGLPVADWTADEAGQAFMLLGAHLGTPVPQNAEGDLLGHVRDDGSDPDDPSVRRYRTRLAQPFHVDGSDYVGLLCLQKGRSGGLSQIVSSVAIHDEVLRRRPDLEPLLWQPWPFDLYGAGGPDVRHFMAPILSSSSDDQPFRFFYLRWYIDNTQAYPEAPRLTDEQVALLDLVDEIAADPGFCLDMDFEPGDVQLLSNAVILHGRTAYDDDPDHPRHLLRLWLTRRD